MDWLTVFDPYPLWYQTSLHVITVIATPIFLLGFHCVWWHSPKSTNKMFQRLLGSSLAFSYVCQLAISTGSAPVMAFPISGGYPLGYLKYLGVPTTFQLGMIFHAITIVMLFTLLLFFNRHNILAPLPSVANYAFLIIAVLMTIIVPFAVINFLLLGNLDQMREKTYFLVKYPDLCNKIPNLWDDVVLFIDLNRNNRRWYVNIFYLILINLVLICIAFFVSRIRFHLNTSMISSTTKSMHRALVKTLIIQSTVHYVLILLPSATLISCFMLAIELPGLSSISFILLATADPCSVVALILSHKGYRKATTELIGSSRKKLADLAHFREHPPSVSSIMVARQ